LSTENAASDPLAEHCPVTQAAFFSYTPINATAFNYLYNRRVEADRNFSYLLRAILVYQPKGLNRDWSPRFSTLRDKNGWI
jgi:hypothetical protein